MKQRSSSLLYIILYVFFVSTSTISVKGDGQKFWKQASSHQAAEVAQYTSNCSLDQAIIDEIHSYQDTVDSIIELFLTGAFKGVSYDVLEEFTDTFGPRMTGTVALENTIDWILNRATRLFFDKIYTEPVTAPLWIRNNESLYLISPRKQELKFKSLGTSIGTEPEGLTANVLVVTSYDDLTAKASLAVGKIVVFNIPFTEYYVNADYRNNGAPAVAKVGGIASLISSVTSFSISSPHTGTQFYEEGVPEIPTACITIEDADMLNRMQLRGETITLHLKMGAELLGDFVTRNSIIEIAGSEAPDEVVVVSGHIDSWDVGQGAMDDGGGSTVSFVAGEAILHLGLKPRRTFRTILFSAEEQGIYGGAQYFTAHISESANFQIMMESDFGTFYPRGIAFSGNQEANCMMNEILDLTKLLGTDRVDFDAADTPDLSSFGAIGVPTASLLNDNDRYIWFHHSDGDTLAVQDSDSMDRVAALWTAVSYVLADVSFRLPHGN